MISSHLPYHSAPLIVAAGILAGVVHVLSGPDHLAAIAPLALKSVRRAWLVGLRWGGGHAMGVVVVGVASLILRGVLPVDLISDWSERLVGVLLIGIGAWTLRAALRIHTHAHDHAGESHVHIHLHGPRAQVVDRNTEHSVHGHAAFGIGTLHGLAGSSHFLAIIPSLTLPSNSLAVAYLVAYGAGTILAMMLFSSTISSLTARIARSANVYRGLMFGCSATAILVGCFWRANVNF